MKLRFRITHLLPIFTFLIPVLLLGQLSNEINPKLLESSWDANWIAHPTESRTEYGVYLFKKEFNLATLPEKFVVHVSADNRYKLYINGNYITNGPARGDEQNWRFESLDIASYLKSGTNVVSAVVWNFAQYRPLAQHSTKTGFLLQGNSYVEKVLNTDETWSVAKDKAYSPLPVSMNEFYVVGPGEHFDGSLHPWSWMNAGYESDFVKAKAFEPAQTQKSLKHWGNIPALVLTPRTIPLMEEHLQRFESVRRSSHTNDIKSNFLLGEGSLSIPKNTQTSILIDQGHLTNAYPVLNYGGGKGASIKITYAESLFNTNGQKGNRDAIENKSIKGNSDAIIADGGAQRTFQTLWWRTFRYVQLDIETKDEALKIDDFHSISTGYPFKEIASFKSSVPVLSNIWDVGWRTQLLCSGENYFDCPYYEQLQYAGDTRIQCLISSYISGDFKLFKNALESYNHSKMPFGLTQSRYPSFDTQIIPTFSLVWITMLHDYWMLNPENDFVEQMIPDVLDIVQWFENRLDNNDMLGHLEYWQFVDWVNYEGWEHGVPPGVYHDNSAIISLQLVYTLQKGAELLEHHNRPDESQKMEALANKIKTAVLKQCWVEEKGLIADTPDKKLFSQHANILAILTETIAPKNAKNLMEKVLVEKEMAQCTYYFTFYLVEALKKAGMADKYLSTLEPWEEMLDNGLTTFAEKPDPTRSDCHAWSASPNYYFLSLITGIEPMEPGFESVRIAPNLGDLPEIESSMPHHLGMIQIKLKKSKETGITGTVQLPEKLDGIFEWNGKQIALNPGTNTINL
ncbi:alpha-rhamnosidase [Muricauda sp. CAU 1633]|uniref:alpha-L-rhamnosidase-related protein n=1 Tax=Allomuricauda sp. CAU 1633 TaxID=2816036 RepID=UPI001A8CF543|nr:family 78 glycoside hydrolase catalytic domain [Muricauda sp. CAU 1633]MBO0323777.1 alpha-rhamnosidase [Muricauda sp. CAU 1633]